MIFAPRNRYVLLEEIVLEQEEEEKTTTILLPEEYKVKTNPYDTYTVVACSEDCTKVDNSDLGKRVVVNNAMIETINISHDKHLIILENHIVGVLQDEEI